MAHAFMWYETKISQDLINLIDKDLKEKFATPTDTSLLLNGHQDLSIRNSKNSWIPSTYWLSGLIWHYVQLANNQNFLYDIKNIDGQSLQYTYYNTGEYYNWHSDSSISELYAPQNKNANSDINDFLNETTNFVRKLSFSLLLSDHDDYEGGNFQFLMNGKTLFAPRIKGTLIIFDSRIPHRVLKVKKGCRRSIVGWVVGPRWR